MREMSAGYQQVMDFAGEWDEEGVEEEEVKRERVETQHKLHDHPLPTAVDAWRADRTGFPEVVWAPGKSPSQIAAILTAISANDRVALASRVEPDVAPAVAAALGPDDAPRLKYNETGRLLSLTSPSGRRQPRLPGTAVVISAGTADERVAEECRSVADAIGVYAYRLADVSVDSLHELLGNLPAVRAADVVVVVAGTDGALPAVVAGLVEAPVVAVPTSVGYGCRPRRRDPPAVCPGGVIPWCDGRQHRQWFRGRDGRRPHPAHRGQAEAGGGAAQGRVSVCVCERERVKGEEERERGGSPETIFLSPPRFFAPKSHFLFERHAPLWRVFWLC